MSSSPFKTAKFKATQKKWYERLADKGFSDIEQPDGNLKVWESRMFQNRYDPKRAETDTEYYRLAGQFLFEFEFANKRDRYLWELHSTGFTSREIRSTLKKKNMTPYYLQSIQDTIDLFRKEMLGAYDKDN